MKLPLLIVVLLAPLIAAASDARYAHAHCSALAFESGAHVAAQDHLRAGYAAVRNGPDVLVGNEAYRLGSSKTEGAAFMFRQIYAWKWRNVRDELDKAAERSAAAHKEAAEAKYDAANCGRLLKW